MYPDWPECADLVPLPHCDGPKLKPFDFQGPQKIEFSEFLGQGTHSFVFKIKISGQTYALKLFRFVYQDDWLGPGSDANPNDLKLMSAFYHYSEPFSCECRAFGRLQETGHDDLAVKCFGYVLLDAEHERALMDQFRDLKLDFNGNIYRTGAEDVRSRFLGKDGRPPPIRGIVKEFGQGLKDLPTKHLRRILRDIIQFQQLGIICIDVADRQIINGKFSDLSTTITVPHFITTPELNPLLTPEWISAMEFETFQFSIGDYWYFDEMVRVWNDEHEDLKNKLSVFAFPGGRCQIKYNLRSTPSRERVYSLVDPRLFDWKASAAGTKNGVTGENTGCDSGKAVDEHKSERKAKCSPGKLGKVSRGAISKARRRLDAKPPRWYYDCDSKVAAELKSAIDFSTSLSWEFKDGYIFPMEKC